MIVTRASMARFASANTRSVASNLVLIKMSFRPLASRRSTRESAISHSRDAQFSICVRRFNNSRTVSRSSLTFIMSVTGVAKRADGVGKACERCCLVLPRARTVGEFLPATAAGPGGAAAKITGATVLALGSQLGGQLTKRTEYEPHARAGGAFLSGGVPAIWRNMPFYAPKTKAAADMVHQMIPAGVGMARWH